MVDRQKLVERIRVADNEPWPTVLPGAQEHASRFPVDPRPSSHLTPLIPPGLSIPSREIVSLKLAASLEQTTSLGPATSLEPAAFPQIIPKRRSIHGYGFVRDPNRLDRAAEHSRIESQLADLEALQRQQGFIRQPPKHYFTLVDTPERVIMMLDSLDQKFYHSQSAQAYIAIDCEGVNLGRHGSLSTMAIFDQAKDHTYCVDIHVLKSAAFHIVSTGGSSSLKSILESRWILKLLYDCRRDAEALYAHYGVQLAHVADLQLLNCASRKPENRYWRKSLVDALQDDAGLSEQWKVEIANVKRLGKEIFTNDNFTAWEERPLNKALLTYSDADVRCLPNIYAKYMCDLEGNLEALNEAESLTALALDQAFGYFDTPASQIPSRSPYCYYERCDEPRWVVGPNPNVGDWVWFMFWKLREDEAVVGVEAGIES